MKLVYVADSRTPPAWAARGYEAALKIWERGGENTSQIAPGPWRHAWGVHHPADDHAAAFATIGGRLEELACDSYGLDLEFGWEYDGDVFGWGDNADPVEMRRIRELHHDLRGHVDGLGVPFWLSLLAHKLYPLDLWIPGATFVTVQLYGERDPLPDADAAWAQFLGFLPHHLAFPVSADPRASVPAAFGGATAAPAPVDVVDGLALPSLWTGQPNPRADGQCVRFDAEIMADEDYR